MIGLPRSSLHYQSANRDNDALRLALIRLAKQYGRYGYRKIAELLRIEGWKVNHKKVERIWREEGLQLPQRHKKRRRLYHKDSSIIRLRPTHSNHVWAIDFVHDKLCNGRSYKMLTVLDEYTRQALAVTVRTRMTADDVLEALYPLLLRYGTPEYIRSDNGPEFIATAMQDWLARVGIKPIRIYPGSPWENGYNERFNGHSAPRGAQCRVVYYDKAGSDRHQPVAQAVQQYPTTSGPEHATASPRNSNQEWHRTWGLDRAIPSKRF